MITFTNLENFVNDLDSHIKESTDWVDYPEDSVERGSVWHMDAETAPMGRIYDKDNFRSHIEMCLKGLLDELADVVRLEIGEDIYVIERDDYDGVVVS